MFEDRSKLQLPGLERLEVKFFWKDNLVIPNSPFSYQFINTKSDYTTFLFCMPSYLMS